jgi:hypothetical protein
MINRRQFLVNGFGVISGFYLTASMATLSATGEEQRQSFVPDDRQESENTFDWEKMIAREIEVGMREQALGRDPNEAIILMRQLYR